jgi:hypothetical protein
MPSDEGRPFRKSARFFLRRILTSQMKVHNMIEERKFSQTEFAGGLPGGIALNFRQPQEAGKAFKAPQRITTAQDLARSERGWASADKPRFKGAAAESILSRGWSSLRERSSIPI